MHLAKSYKTWFLCMMAYAILAAIMVYPLFSAYTIPANIDYVAHLNAIIHAKFALMHGQFPLRIAETEHQGFAYPLFQFYSTSTYTIAGLIHQYMTSNPWTAYKLTIWLAFFIGSIYLNRLINYLFQCQLTAFLAGIVYLTLPYHLTVINYLGAFNEAVAIGFLPVVIFYSIHEYYSAKMSTFLLAGLSWYLLATIHLITFITTSFIFFSWLLLLSLQKRIHLKKMVRPLAAYIFGCLLAAWYLVPIISLRHYFIANYTFNSADILFQYRPDLIKLLLPYPDFNNLSYTTDGYIHAVIKYQPSIGVLSILVFSICCYLFIGNRNKSHAILDSTIILFLAIFILIWSPFNFWKFLPNLFLVVQYSYRLLAQLSWLSILLFAIAAHYILQIQKLKKIFTAVIILLSGLTMFSWLHAKQDYDNYKNVLPSFRNSDFYLMDAHSHPELINIVDNVLLESGQIKNFIDTSKILNVKQMKSFCYQSSINTKCDIYVPSQIKMLELPIFYFPEMFTIKRNDRIINYFSVYNRDQLFVGIVADPGKINRISVEFTGNRAANYISATMWQIFLLCCGYLMVRVLKERYLKQFFNCFILARLRIIRLMNKNAVP